MKDLWYGTSGPRDAPIVIVGEAWGYNEAAAEQPFVGESGKLLDRILAEAGLDRTKILVTNTAAVRPLNNEMWRMFYATDEAKSRGLSDVGGLYPTDELIEEIRRLYRQITFCSRTVVITTGNYPLWACGRGCTGYDTPDDAQGRRVPNGIMNWRGSMWYVAPHDIFLPTPAMSSIRLLPVIHPAAIMRQYTLRAVTVHDFKQRVPQAIADDWRNPNPPTILAPPTFEQACDKLNEWINRARAGETVYVAEDVETMRNMITVTGFADDNFAMAIPWIVEHPNRQWTSYWPHEQEKELVRLINLLHSTDGVCIEGQNFLYDMQYEHAYMGVPPKPDFDTMLAHHLLFPGTPKGLAYLSSLYCRYHWYWKGATGDDDKASVGRFDPSEWLEYNCLDTLRTRECARQLRQLIAQLGMEEQWKWQMRKNDLAFRMMNRGVKIDIARRSKLSYDLMNTTSALQSRLGSIIPCDLVDSTLEHITGKKQSKTPWYTSPTKQKLFFSEVLGMKLPSHRKTKKATMGKEALNELPKKYPIWTTVFDLMGAMRSVGVFQSHFISAPLDPDKRMRCMFKPAGTETFRWSSSANAFRRGTNLQNIPSGDEE